MIARTLSPGDYGVMGMIIIFISLGQLLMEGGFSMALIQKKEATESDYSTVFWFNVAVSVIVYLILYFTAGAIADFYDTHILVNVIRVSALVIILNALVAVQSVKLSRQMNFRRQAVINLIATLFSGITGVVMALKGYAVWSLVFQTLAGSLVNMTGLWISSGWRPILTFNSGSFKELFNYGYKIFLLGFGDVIFTKIYFPLIGRFFPVEQLGYYSNSNRFYDLFVRQVSSSFNRVVFPAFSSIQEEKERFTANYLRSFGMLAFVMSLLMVTMIISSGQFVELFLGSKWMPAVPLMVVFFIEGFYFPLLMLNQNLLSALGHSGRALQIDIVRKVLTLASIFLTFRYGIRALIAGQVISTLLAFILSTIVMMRNLQISPGRLIKNVFTIIIIVTVCFLTDDFVIDRLFASTTALLLVKLCCIPALYLLTGWVLKVPSLRELTVLVKDHLSRGRKATDNE